MCTSYAQRVRGVLPEGPGRPGAAMLVAIGWEALEGSGGAATSWPCRLRQGPHDSTMLFTLAICAVRRLFLGGPFAQMGKLDGVLCSLVSCVTRPLGLIPRAMWRL